MRYDIAFFLCCCRSFLSSSGRDEDESFYDLLGVPVDAGMDDLRRAYKRQSLLMHPDKLAQRGQVVTEIDRDRFTRMRHAYEVLSDPRRRETYDAVGERGMRWIEEPLSVDPRELAHNFATSSVLDRSKIFAIFLILYVAIFVLPILVCLMADGLLGRYAKWTCVLIPLWFWDAIILFYHSRVILMGPIRRPENVPEEEWVDPLPMVRRVVAMIRFGLLVIFQILLALRLDGHLANLPWIIVFVPLFLWDAMALRRKVALSSLVVVTHDELELAIGKRLGECTASEREDLMRRYVVVPTNSEDARDAANRLVSDARVDVVRILARISFAMLLALNLDSGYDWSWWLVFLPVFGTSAIVVGWALRNFAHAQSEAARMDPAAFGGGGDGGGELGHDPGDGDGRGESSTSPYAKINGNGKGDDASPLSDEEREELRARVAQSAYRAAGTCLSQCFVVVMACVLIGKIEGAGYSLLIVISPFLAAGGIVLCCLACTIFCISEVDENAGMAEFDTAIGRAVAAGGASTGYGSVGASAKGYDPPTAQGREDVPCDAADIAPGGHRETTATGASTTSTTTTSCRTSAKPPPSSTWDPELGEIWRNTTNSVDVEDCEVAKRDETEVSATNVLDAECRRIEENHSISSSQCDLD
ncbi:hypothetical protein ACHAXA_011480 [Cyclostephanos tholiformis]|uniref:J domain-containing protein n=1 Tax=Cyclostephanos tholiformis TaxID=382380 RepID=A0ABD3SEN3_9STRA